MESVSGQVSSVMHDISGNGCAYPPAHGTSHTLSIQHPGLETKEISRVSPNRLQTSPSPKVLVWSAADEGGSNRLSTVYGQHFACLSLQPEEAEVYVENLAFTLGVRRSTLPWRSFLVASSLGQLHDMQAKLSKPMRAVTNPKLGFIFTGQGAQWYAMGRELMSYTVFRDSIQKAEVQFNGFGCQWSLMSMASILAIVQV